MERPAPPASAPSTADLPHRLETAPRLPPPQNSLLAGASAPAPPLAWPPATLPPATPSERRPAHGIPPPTHQNEQAPETSRSSAQYAQSGRDETGAAKRASGNSRWYTRTRG